MTHTPHEITAEFPEFSEKIHALKSDNAHFAKLVDDYHDLNRAIHRMETNVEPVSDHVEKQARHKRSTLKDEIYQLLKAA